MPLFNIFKKQNNDIPKPSLPSKPTQENDIISQSEAMLAEVEVDISLLDAVKLPIDQLALLGAGVSSILPSLRTISQTISIDGGDRLFRWVNGDNAQGTLKLNKKDNLLGGSFVDKIGVSRYAKFEKLDAQAVSSTAVMPINPAVLIIAGVLMNIEKKLDTIVDMEKQILSYLEKDKESEIEADLKALTEIIKEYKYNFDNAEYKTNHHKLALDIKRTSERNIIFYQKQILEAMKDNKLFHVQNDINSKQKSLQSLFRYYRMSTYIYSFSSYIEVMLLGNFRTEYINQVKSKVEEYSSEYSKVHSDCLEGLKKQTESSLDRRILKGVGTATKAVGGLIGSIPKVKNGNVDEWLADKGEDMQKQSESIGSEALSEFESISDSGSGTFIESLVMLDRLNNNTSEIYIDGGNVYLVAEKG